MLTKPECPSCRHRRADKCVSDFVAPIVGTTDVSKALPWCGLRFFQVKQEHNEQFPQPVPYQSRAAKLRKQKKEQK